MDNSTTSVVLPPLKRSACLNCRRSKIKCVRREADDKRCEKCAQSGQECIVQGYHAGRRKGVKNKRTGLDKTLYQLENAIKQSEHKDQLSELGTVVANVQQLLRHDASNTQTETNTATNSSPTVHSDISPQSSPGNDRLAVDDVENPLQLLAHASDLQNPRPAPSQQYTQTQVSTSISSAHSQDLGDFFRPIRATLDIGSEVDPIDLGLTSLDEAETLFALFYNDLAHTRWGLDPTIHTVAFVRSRSAFLLTSILAASALFIPTEAALCKRLSIHRNRLALELISRRCRSVEIVLAFMLNIPWMSPGEHSAADDTCSFIAVALTIALDLSLNKAVIPSSGISIAELKRISRADCIDGRRALLIDGYDNIDPNSEWGRRLLRQRERTWFALFALERGTCMARGRECIVPLTPLVELCDSWYKSELACIEDASMISIAVLRRDRENLVRTVRAICDGYRVIDEESEVAQRIKTTIEAFYANWLAKWSSEIRRDQTNSLPPYVEILIIHGQLSTYTGIINHPTAPNDVKRFFRTASLSAALNVMRAVIQSESRLRSMPNNTVIMVSFAACFALSVSASSNGKAFALAPSVRALIEETADVLQRVGAITPHRQGASTLYGKYLYKLVQHAARLDASQDNLQTSIPSFSAGPACYNPIAVPVNESSFGNQGFQVEPLQFSVMSDDQITEAVGKVPMPVDFSMAPYPTEYISDWTWTDWGDMPDFNL